jgi:drug/metabolite transporter (DMT)-like permease
VLAAVLWGLYWIPVRGIEQSGVSAFWTGAVIFGASSLLFAPYFILRFRSFVSNWRSILVPGILSGFAFAFYIASFNLTDVVRAILLFYMSPLWSTLLGVLILKERLTLNRIVALLLAFSGLYVILAVDGTLPVPSNTGDWFAMLSGFCWSIASVKLFQGGATLIPEKVTVFVFFALLASLALIFWNEGGLGGMPDRQSLANAWYWIAIVAFLMLPITYFTIWPATLLSPGRVSMLLMGDVVVGVASAAMLTGERFGAREMIGTLLIVSAAIVEVARQQSIDNSASIERT